LVLVGVMTNLVMMDFNCPIIDECLANSVTCCCMTAAGDGGGDGGDGLLRNDNNNGFLLMAHS